MHTPRVPFSALPRHQNCVDVSSLHRPARVRPTASPREGDTREANSVGRPPFPTSCRLRAMASVAPLPPSLTEGGSSGESPAPASTPMRIDSGTTPPLRKTPTSKINAPASSTGGGTFFDVAEKHRMDEAGKHKIAVAKMLGNVGKRGYVGTKQKRWWVIDPRTNTLVNYWDIASLSALVFTAFVTPYEVGFLNTKIGTPLFWINRLVDVIFLSDMALQFCLGFSVSAGGGKYWEFDACAIALHYVKSPWFYLDTFSILVSAFDYWEDTKSFTALRAVRTLRLIKLARLSRGSRVFKRWEMRFSINYTYLSLFVTCVGILLTCHWCARPPSQPSPFLATRFLCVSRSLSRVRACACRSGRRRRTAGLRASGGCRRHSCPRSSTRGSRATLASAPPTPRPHAAMSASSRTPSTSQPSTGR